MIETGSAADVLSVIDYAEAALVVAGPVVGARMARAGVTPLELAVMPGALMERHGGKVGGRPRDRAKAKAARVARRRNRR